MHITLCATNYFFTFHIVIFFTLFCGLTFQRRSSAENLSCNENPENSLDDENGETKAYNNTETNNN